MLVLLGPTLDAAAAAPPGGWVTVTLPAQLRELADLVEDLEHSDIDVEVQDARLDSVAGDGDLFRANLTVLAPIGAETEAVQEATVDEEPESDEVDDLVASNGADAEEDENLLTDGGSCSVGTDGEGLYAKYDVQKDGEPVKDCFVLVPEDDPAARRALETYIEVTESEALAQDLRDWIASIEIERYTTDNERSGEGDR